MTWLITHNIADVTEENLMSKEIDSLRVSVLKEGIKLTTTDRNETYGDFTRNMQCFGDLLAVYNRYAQGKSHAHNAAMINVLSKISRIAVGPKVHRDNYVDGAVYLAAAYEAEEMLNGQKD